MSNVKVFPEYSGGTTETFLRQLILNFREIEETVTKQITRIILCDLHPLLLDFHTQWVEVLAEAKANGFKASASNAAKSIVTVLTFYFKNLESFSNPVVFFKVISQCCEVVVARYILMIKERSAKSSKFSNEEVSLFCGDTDYLRKYFDEMVGQAVKRLANESSKSLASKSTDSNIDNSLFQISQEVLQARSSRALRHLADLKDLFQLDPTKEPFIAHCKSIIKRYENYPSTFGIPTMMGSYMTSVAVSVRPDGTSGVATVINNIVDSFVKYSLASFGDSDSSNIQDLLEDPVFRVYGSKSAIVNEEDSGEQSIASSQSRSISSFLSGSTVPPSPMKAPSSGNVSGTGAKTALSSSISFKNATSILSSAVSTPHTAMKMIREKAADFKLGGLKLIGGEKAKQKKLDQKTAEIFRILGIIDDGIDSIDKASDDGSDDSSDESDTSEQDNIAADDVCIVRISAVKLRGLKSGALFGSANPYVALNIGHKREKTSVIWGSKEWVWKSSISFKVSLSKLQSSKLTVKVFDKERVRRKRLLGAVTVKLAGLDVTEIQSWFALEGGDTGSNGDVYLNVQLDT